MESMKSFSLLAILLLSVSPALAGNRSRLLSEQLDSISPSVMQRGSRTRTESEPASHQGASASSPQSVRVIPYGGS
jgi:hypothetical protein